MEIRVIVPDKFISVDGRGVFVSELPESLSGLKAIQSIDGKTHILDAKENGSFVNDYDFSKILSVYKIKTDEIDAEEIRALADFEKNKWKYDRANAYPVIGDQLDAVMKWVHQNDSISGELKQIAAACMQVKINIPKGAE